MTRTPKPSGRRERGNSLRRARATRRTKRTFLAFCEGRRTEPEYLNAQPPSVPPTWTTSTLVIRRCSLATIPNQGYTVSSLR